MYKTLNEVLSSRSDMDDSGITFIMGENDEEYISYRALYQRALSVLGRLQQEGIQKGEQLILQIEDNRMFVYVFWACILGGIIPIPVTVGNNEEHKVKLFRIWDRLTSPRMITDRPDINYLCTIENSEQINNTYEDIKKGLIVINSVPELSDIVEIHEACPEDIAFIQFSSGSTGEPKGVILTHENLMTNAYAMIDCAGILTSDITLSWMPLTHDMGIIGFHITPMIKGIQQYVMNTILFIRRPLVWMKKAYEHRITILCSPNFGYKFFLNAFRPELLKGIDLSEVRLIFNGAEPISVELCRSFFEQMKQFSLSHMSMYTVYGLAEAALGVCFPMPGKGMKTVCLDRKCLGIGQTVREIANENSRDKIVFADEGTPINNCSVRICDEDGNDLHQMTVGFIHIKGKNVTSGYFNDTQATASAITKDGWLNTGDLGFLRNGRLVVTGRAKDVIIIGGQNYYSHDIERLCEKVEGVELGKVAACGVYVDDAQKENMVIFVIHKGNLKRFVPIALNVKKQVNRTIGLQVHEVVPVKSIPKTTSGKMQRHKLIEKYRLKEFQPLIEQLSTYISKELANREILSPANEIESKLVEIWSSVLKTDCISVNDNFFEIGGTSEALVRMHACMEEEYPGKVAITDYYAYPTISQIARYIQFGTKRFNESDPSENQGEGQWDMAIIGMAVRLPMADSIEEYWENIRNRVDCIRKIPEGRRRDTEKYLDHIKTDRKKRKYMEASYLEEVDKFDYDYFKITPKTASLMDPHQRIFLETAWEAMEDAGYGGDVLFGSKTGTYVGYGNDSDYLRFISNIDSSLVNMSIPGNIKPIIASRISYIMDFTGPSMVVDTACSSSLVAVHLACQAIKNGECDLAIAGGIKLNLLPLEEEHKIGIESSDARTRAFDDSSNGSGLGEGAAAVLIKPLSKAIADNDNIYAVIKGGAVNQDGRSIGITAPNTKAQENLLIDAWKNSAISPETITYIESHGTGTNLGDPIEIDAINKAFGRYTSKSHFCALGAVKTNIGHLYHAAGIAGLIKAVMALKMRELPPNVYFNKPNRNANFVASPIFVNTVPRCWESADQPRRCGVSSFGMSGTNCHIVLEEAPAAVENSTANNSYPQLFTVSAKTEVSLRKALEKYRDALSKKEKLSIKNICYTVNYGRGHYNMRLAFLVRNIDDLKEKLDHVCQKGIDASIEGVFYGVHTITGINRKKDNDGDITKNEIYELSSICDTKIRKFIEAGKNDGGLLEEICLLYVKGADVSWKSLYAGEKVNKISLPGYQFYRQRCWIDVPGQQNLGLYYTTGWIGKELSGTQVENIQNKRVVILRGKSAIGREVAFRLNAANNDVVEVELGNRFEKLDSNRFIVSGSEEDYKTLMGSLKGRNIDMILHMFTLDEEEESKGLEAVEEKLKNGVYNLFNLTKSLALNFVGKTDLLLISCYVSEVSSEEQVIIPEHASLFGLGKVIGQEHPNIRCRAIDIDQDTTADDIILELSCKEAESYQVAYRKGTRYIEEFRNIVFKNGDDDKLEIRQEGVYVITGGLGGIGLEIAKYLASGNKIKVVTINRSAFPERTRWKEILSKGGNEELSGKIKALLAIEAGGSTVECYSADVSKIDEVSAALEDVRRKFGSIHGVVHSAGQISGSIIMKKSREGFENVLKPKVHGAWVLDRLTQQDDLDFFVLFSSGLSMLGEAGMSDYVAANSALDSFSHMRKRRGRKTTAINWVPWKDVGSSVRFGINRDNIFKALETGQAVNAFANLVNSDITRILVGEFNQEGPLEQILEQRVIKLSDDIRKYLEASASCKAVRFNQESHVKKEQDGEVRLTGNDSMSYSETEKQIASIFRETLGYKDINVHDSFFELGGDSVLLTRMYGLLDGKFPGKLRIADVFEFSSVAKLAECIENRDDKRGLKGFRKKGSSQDIAIIGIAARLPGTDSIEEFWENIRNGIDCIGKFPKQRREDIDKYLKFLHLQNNKMGDSDARYLEGAYLDEIDRFDYQFFRLSPKEASLMDPHQRIFLQTAWQAIEDAGYGGKRLTGTRTGLYVGFASNAKDSYAKMIGDIDPSQLPFGMYGNIPAIIPGRVAYLLDLKGPAMLVDTACSSSLVAVHLACQAIRIGDCDVAIAGGIKLQMLPVEKDIYKLGIESSTYRSKSFDNDSDGAGMGEGFAAILIKPLEKAVKDGDNIYAVIKGSAVGQDGSSMGLTTPSPGAQEDVIIRAWMDAEINPEDISFIEAHGTGTPLGDPIEIAALQRAFERFTHKKNFCGIGTVKTNIGHLWECSGIAGIIKMVLAMKHGELPPSIHFNSPNQKIDFINSPVYVNKRLVNWSMVEKKRLCGVSSFGISGTNCHMVLEEYKSQNSLKESTDGINVFTLSAKSRESMEALIKDYLDYILNEAKLDMAGICYTANTGRGHYNYRLAAIVRDAEEFKNLILLLSEKGSETLQQSRYYFGEVNIVSDSVERLKENEITEKNARFLSKLAGIKVKDFVESNQCDEEALEGICQMYVQGADVEWEDLYVKSQKYKVRLPVYNFRKNKCWIKIPQVQNAGLTPSLYSNANSENEYYSVSWIEEALRPREWGLEDKTYLILKDAKGVGGRIAHMLKDAGRQVVEVETSSGIEKYSPNAYKMPATYDGFAFLMKELGDKKNIQILHMTTLKEKCSEEDGLENGLDRMKEIKRDGVLSLFNLSRAINDAEYKGNIEIVLLSEYAFEVTGNEKIILPENAMLSAFGKVVSIENLNVGCRSIDIDDQLDASQILEEIKSEKTAFRVSYRQGSRYVEQFGQKDIKSEPKLDINLRQEGVYIISGGAGGIGLEMAKYLASNEKIHLAFINRSNIPGRDEWEQIIRSGSDRKLCKKINTVRQVEANGSTVEICAADISKIHEMNDIMTSLRNKYGRINGIIHAAGVAGDSFITQKTEEEIECVLSPKVDGTWVLERLTQNDQLDFFILFSSTASLFSGPGQSDYAAANIYLDSFSSFMNRQGKRALTINWATWRDTGMAFDAGFQNDTLYKTLSIEEGVSAFNEVFKKNLGCVIIGKLNFESKAVNILEHQEVRLEPGLQVRLGSNKHLRESANEAAHFTEIENVVVKGKSGGDYTQIEFKVAQVFGKALGCPEVDIHDNLFEMGVDSFSMMVIISNLNKELNVKLGLKDVMGRSNIAEIAEVVHLINNGM